MAEKIEFPQPHSHFLSERDLKYQNAVNEKYELQRQLDALREQNAPGPNSGSNNRYNNAQSQMNLLQSFYAQQQAAAAALEAQRRAAAQAAYDRSMAALNSSYNTMQNSLKGNYNSTLGQLEQNYNTGVAGVNKQADNAQQQAYINYMMNKRDMGQQLAAQGLSGGASESALAGMYNNYGNSRNTIDSGRNDSLADLMNDWNTNKASALQAYNSQLAEMAMQKANAVQQLENNLANLIAQAAADNYNTQFSLTNEYLNRMLDLAGNSGSYASSVAKRSYDGGNNVKKIDTTQGENGYTPVRAKAVTFDALAERQAEQDAIEEAENPYTWYLHNVVGGTWPGRYYANR